MADNCLPEDVNGGKIVPKSRDRAMTEMTFCNAPSSQVDPGETVKAIRKFLRRSQIGMDAIVVHEDAMQRLREIIRKRWEPEEILSNDVFMCGIPVYSRPSDKECIELAIELRSQGKRVAITLSESYLPDGIDFWLKKESPEESDGPAETKEARLPDCKGESEITGDVGALGDLGDDDIQLTVQPGSFAGWENSKTVGTHRDELFAKIREARDKIEFAKTLGPPPDPPLDAGDQAPNFEHHVFGYADNSAFRKPFPPGPPQAD